MGPSPRPGQCRQQRQQQRQVRQQWNISLEFFFIDTWSILLLDNEVDFNENLHFRPSFSKDGFYSGYDINGNDVNFYINQINQNSNLHFNCPSVGMYTQNNQRDVLTSLLGSADLADVYLPGLSLPSVHIQCSTAQYSTFIVHVQYIYKVDRLCQEETCTSLGDISHQMLTLWTTPGRSDNIFGKL